MARRNAGAAARLRSRLLLCGCMLLLAGLSTHAPLQAQEDVVLGAGGAALGFVAGAYTTTAIYVAKARTGRYLFSVDEVMELGPESLPVLVGPVAGAAVGIRSGEALGRMALWGGVGLAGGAALGAVAGELVWRTDEGRWAGAVMGSALGMLVGAALGAAEGWHEEDGGGAPAMQARVSIPLSLGGR